MTKSASLFAAMILAALSSGASAQSALQQLKDANSGDQPTGKTFDNNIHPQQMDAYPKNSGNVASPPSSAPSQYSAPSSTGSASGYGGAPASSAPATAKTVTAKKTGTETTKK
jgi:hypothetical protein